MTTTLSASAAPPAIGGECLECGCPLRRGHEDTLDFGPSEGYCSLRCEQLASARALHTALHEERQWHRHYQRELMPLTGVWQTALAERFAHAPEGMTRCRFCTALAADPTGNTEFCNPTCQTEFWRHYEQWAEAQEVPVHAA